MATGTLTYDGKIFNIGDFSVTIPYTAIYDADKNCTTVVFGECSHTILSKGEVGVGGRTVITVTAEDDLSSSMQTVFTTRGNSVTVANNTSILPYYATPPVSTLNIQHSTNSGEKKIIISASTKITTMAEVSETQYGEYYASGSITTESLGVNTSLINTNSMFRNRANGLAYSSGYSTIYNNCPMGSILYITDYDPDTNCTTITFSNAVARVSGARNYNFKSRFTITVTPKDGGEPVTFYYYRQTTTAGSAAYYDYDMYYSIDGSSETDKTSNTVVIQHASEEDGERSVDITFDTYYWIYLSTSYYWEPTGSYTQSIITGVHGEFGCIYIDNGSGWDAYQIYIDNGTSWDLYVPYIDNGTSWDLYG